MRTRTRRVVGIVAVALTLATASACEVPDHLVENWVQRWPAVTSSEGRWFVDHVGRVVLLRGVNEVYKSPPYHPAAEGFGDDDAAFLAERGFNVVRLGVSFMALMPEPGVVDAGYVTAIEGSVQALSRHRIHAILDFHQDGYGPLTHGNGMPAWATLTDGLPNPDVPFPAYYVQNPALQRAFDNFWANREVEGVGLQDHYAHAAGELARRLARYRWVLGYEAMNEPWPGTDWTACATGCPDLEADLLVPFYERFDTAVRAWDADAIVMYEPFVLFNFGHTDTTLPRIGPNGALAPHVYALSPEEDASVIARSVAAGDASGQAVVIGEFGATNDRATLERQAGQLDDGLLSWAFWAYNENMVWNQHQPPGPGNMVESTMAALTRPYPRLTDGTPLELAFDPVTRTMTNRYSTTRPDGSQGDRGLSAYEVPATVFPDGYSVDVVGGRVRSAPCAPVLIVEAAKGGAEVSVTVTPGGDCAA